MRPRQTPIGTRDQEPRTPRSPSKPKSSRTNLGPFHVRTVQGFHTTTKPRPRVWYSGRPDLAGRLLSPSLHASWRPRRTESRGSPSPRVGSSYDTRAPLCSPCDPNPFTASDPKPFTASSSPGPDPAVHLSVTTAENPDPKHQTPTLLTFVSPSPSVPRSLFPRPL